MDDRFKEGRDTTKIDKRKGRLVTVSNERKVAEIQEYILEDRRVTVENVAEHFGISYGTAQDIMSNKLGMRRVSGRWVPRLLLPEQMGVRVKMCNEYCRQYKNEDDTFLNRVVTLIMRLLTLCSAPLHQRHETAFPKKDVKYSPMGNTAVLQRYLKHNPIMLLKRYI